MPWLVVSLWSSAGLGPKAFPIILAIMPTVALMLMLYIRTRCEGNEGGVEVLKGCTIVGGEEGQGIEAYMPPVVMVVGDTEKGEIEMSSTQ